jgi:hypothetical protein
MVREGKRKGMSISSGENGPGKEGKEERPEGDKEGETEGKKHGREEAR